MPWLKVEDCPDYQGVNWIHPYFQCEVAKYVEAAKTNREVRALVVFGSITTDRCHAGSDIDICVVGDKHRTFVPPLNSFIPCDAVWIDGLDNTYDLFQTIKERGIVVYEPVPS